MREQNNNKQRITKKMKFTIIATISGAILAASLPFVKIMDVSTYQSIDVAAPVEVEHIGPLNSHNAQCTKEFPKQDINDMKKIEEYIAVCAEKSYIWYNIAF